MSTQVRNEFREQYETTADAQARADKDIAEKVLYMLDVASKNEGLEQRMEIGVVGSKTRDRGAVTVSVVYKSTSEDKLQ